MNLLKQRHLNKMNMKYLLLIFICLGFPFLSYAQANDKAQVGLDEKYGNYLPLNLTFYNSDGDTVLLKNVITKPTLIALVYYQCTGLCTPMQSELAWIVDQVKLTPGVDFKLLSISFNHHETPVIAAKWKRSYLQTIKRKFDPKDWLFLTGDSVNIKLLTNACGFYFKPTENQIMHTSVVIAISPDGKISRYLYGPDFNPFDVKMALLEAGSGKANPAITQTLQYCFTFDPAGRRYTLNITRIVGAVMLLTVGIYLSMLLLKKENKVKSEVKGNES